MAFPQHRPRRLRSSQAMRSLVEDVNLSHKDLILPIFLDENIPSSTAQSRDVLSMPGVAVHNIESGLVLAEKALNKGLPAVILFGIPEHKDDEGSTGDRNQAIVPRFAARLKKEFGQQLVVIADLCLCEYTQHGHCGILNEDGIVQNDKTLERLASFAQCYARNQVDCVAPSGMMDGMVQAIRTSLDQIGFSQLPILSYAVKYATSYYGPFREAALSTPSFGDRKTYQMPYANSWEALREAELDISEGADIIMVKPALPYLDIISKLKEKFAVPIFAYQVSGEYAMIKAGGQAGMIDESAIMIESLVAMKRAGSTAIISYAALDVDL